MHAWPPGTVAVIFCSTRTGVDEPGYAAAAEQMRALAAEQPGYLGIRSVRGPDGSGITISYWADEPSAVAWRRHAEHSLIRAEGRARWYRDYTLEVAEVTRSYDWRAGGETP